jgi:hypothetical protein
MFLEKQRQIFEASRGEHFMLPPLRANSLGGAPGERYGLAHVLYGIWDSVIPGFPGICPGLSEGSTRASALSAAAPRHRGATVWAFLGSQSRRIFGHAGQLKQVPYFLPLSTRQGVSRDSAAVCESMGKMSHARAFR